MQDRASRPETDVAELLEAKQGAVAILTLNRPEARNSLSLSLLRALSDAVARLSADPDTRAVVLAGNGPVFSAGHDLKELNSHRADADGGLAFYRTAMQTCSCVMQAILRSPKPFIAAVHGTATAAGCQLVASCDLAVAAEEAEFATPGVNIGLFCSTPMVALSRNVPRKRAMEMLLLGEMLSARDAAAYGLVNRVVPREKVLDEALAMANVIAAKSSLTIAIGKEAFYSQVEMRTAEAYDYAADVMVRNMMAHDAAEGICAFIEKREPCWKDS